MENNTTTMSYPAIVEPEDKYPEDLGNNGEPTVEPQDEPEPDPDEVAREHAEDEADRLEERYDSHVASSVWG